MRAGKDLRFGRPEHRKPDDLKEVARSCDTPGQSKSARGMSNHLPSILRVTRKITTAYESIEDYQCGLLLDFIAAGWVQR